MVEEASDTAPEVVLNKLPESTTELKEWFEGKDFPKDILKNVHPNRLII